MTLQPKALSMSRSRVLVISGMVFFALLMLFGSFVPSLGLISLASLIMICMAVPLIYSRRMDLFSPWNWLFYYTFIGVFLRSIYITFDIPNEFTIASVFLRGEPKEFLSWPMVVVLLGLCFSIFGYLAGTTLPGKIPLLIFQSDHWSKNRFWFVLLVLLPIAWIGFFLYIVNTSGSLDMENLSAHRTISDNLSDYSSYGYFRWMVYLSDLVCYLVMANMLSRRHIQFKEFVVFLLSLGTSLFYYYYIQTRSGILGVVLSLLVIVYYLHGRKFPVKIGLVAIPLASFFFLLMTTLRPGSGYTGKDPLVLIRNPILAIEPLIMNINGIDVSKTAHIMAAVGKQLNYQWGGTLLNIFTLWIPRQLWPEKPVNVDTMVGMAVFGAQSYGAGAVPPGLIAEMYWNFGFPGIIIGCFLTGYLLRMIFKQFLLYSNNRNIVLWYVVSFMQLGVALMGSSFSSALLSFLMTSIPLLIILRFITRRDVPAIELLPRTNSHSLSQSDVSSGQNQNSSKGEDRHGINGEIRQFGENS